MTWYEGAGGNGGGVLFPLNTVRVNQRPEEETDRDGEEMRFGEGAGSNLWFDIGSPWLSECWREGLSASLLSAPCCFNEFTEILGMANALVYGGRKTGGSEIHL